MGEQGRDVETNEELVMGISLLLFMVHGMSKRQGNSPLYFIIGVMLDKILDI